MHAALVVPAGQRARLERVCRYALRPPVATERLARTADGQVWLRLRAPWRDGTTGFLFDPVDFLGRLAVLVPRPRVNLMLYYGVLGARSAWRADVVGHAGPAATTIRRILEHLGLPADVPAPRPARAPPVPVDADLPGAWSEEPAFDVNR